MEDTAIKSFLEEHPKLLGVLFALVVMSTQVGGVAAFHDVYYGP